MVVAAGEEVEGGAGGVEEGAGRVAGLGWGGGAGGRAVGGEEGWVGGEGVVDPLVGVVVAVTTGGEVGDGEGAGWGCWAESQAGRLSMRVRLRRMEVGGGEAGTGDTAGGGVEAGMGAVVDLGGGGAGEGAAAGEEVETGMGAVVGVVTWVVGGVAVGGFRVIGKEWLSCLARKTRAAASRRPSTAWMKGQPRMVSTVTSSPRAMLMRSGLSSE